MMVCWLLCRRFESLSKKLIGEIFAELEGGLEGLSEPGPDYELLPAIW